MSAQEVGLRVEAIRPQPGDLVLIACDDMTQDELGAVQAWVAARYPQVGFLFASAATDLALLDDHALAGVGLQHIPRPRPVQNPDVSAGATGSGIPRRTGRKGGPIIE